MSYWRKKFIQHRSIIFILGVYFLLHLSNLTLLPIYNDESIYLDWGWFNTHVPGHLYDSLLDSKQPLMIWIFGMFINFFGDPLFAGRFASVLIGSLTVVGIYRVATILFDKKAAFIASLLFSITPLFLFYNRQALMEAGIMCVGVWAFHSLLSVIRLPTTKNAVILGIILGIGFFIKSSSLLFILAAFVCLGITFWRNKQAALLKAAGIALSTMFCVDLLLIINPLFWQSFGTNDRYAYTIKELFEFPFAAWSNHFLAFFEIGFVFVTPLVFLFALLGMALMKKNNTKHYKVFFVFFLLALLLEIFSVRSQSQRYIVPFMTFLVMPAAYVVSMWWDKILWKKLIVVLAFSLPLVSVLLLLFNPELHITKLSKISQYSHVEYTRGQMSGHGIAEVIAYINQQNVASQPTLVFFALNVGNPESAVDVYSHKSPHLYALHIDSSFIPDVQSYQCLTSPYPVFFVTRMDQRVGLDNFFVLEKSFANPDKNYSVRIYKLKSDCTGKSFPLETLYQDAINQLHTIKSGS